MEYISKNIKIFMIFVLLMICSAMICVYTIYLRGTFGESISNHDKSQLSMECHKKEIEIENILKEFDENILDVSVHLGDSRDGVSTVNVLLVYKDNTINTEKQDQIKMVISEKVSVNTDSICIQCVEN